MRNLKFILFAFCALIIFGACSKKYDYGMDLSATGLYFQWGGEPQTITYTTTNVTAVAVKSITNGWKCDIDQTAKTITVTPPAEPQSDSERDKMRECKIMFTVTSTKSEVTTYAIDCYIIGDKVIVLNDGGKYANSYVLTQPMAAYLLDVSHNGAGEAISAVSDVEILWQSERSLLDHLVYDEDKKSVSFYVDALTEEDDEDVYIKENGEYVMRNGNALIAAVNAKGEVLWSWHLWFVKSTANPLEHYTTYSNGVTFMDFNLGAFGNSNGAKDSSKQILDSYGLYYQWGRKDPFLRPYYHDCAGGEDEYVYSGSGSAVYVEYAETSAETGTVEYTVANPTTFIINPACVDSEDGDGVGDWMYSANSSLWSGVNKTLYDPCPYGWRVPAASDFDCLQLTAQEDGMSIEDARGRFGWMLSDGTNNHFYLAAGFRNYYDGVIHNMNFKEGVYPSQPEPWEGYYWTAGATADGKQSTCMYFDLTTTRTINKFNLNYPSKRANAMQIRCVKIK
jgi:uncharacterized protein (TIGR02145 family)